MKERLNSVGEDSRLADKEDESDCADEWRQHKRERSERGEDSSSGKREALEEKRQRNTDKRAEKNCGDGKTKTADDGFEDDLLRENFAIVGERPRSVALKRVDDDGEVWVNHAVKKNEGRDQKQGHGSPRMKKTDLVLHFSRVK